MFKRVCAYLIAVITLGSNPVATEIDYLKPEEAILEIFEKTNCELEYFNTNSYLIYEKEFISIDIGMKICDDIAETLKLKDIIKEKNELSTYRSIVLRGRTDCEDDIVIILQTSEYGNKAETVITIDCKNSNLSNYTTINKGIRDVMNKLGKAKHTTVIVAYENIKASKIMFKDKYIKGLLSNIDGKVVEKYEDKNVISITGYTKRIDEYLEYFDRKANVNIAVRKDEYNKRMYLYLASPIINIEY